MYKVVHGLVVDHHHELVVIYEIMSASFPAVVVVVTIPDLHKNERESKKCRKDTTQHLNVCISINNGVYTDYVCIYT